MRLRFFFLAVLFILSGVSVLPANAQYIKEGEVLTAGKATTVSVPGADTLIITYRPGSNISETYKVKVENSSYEWTPKEAGIVALATPQGPSQTVSVRFSSFSFSGFIVLVLAGGILFGGALYASINLFGKTSPGELTERPDT